VLISYHSPLFLPDNNDHSGELHAAAHIGELASVHQPAITGG
jgi:hypothetical protein